MSCRIFHASVWFARSRTGGYTILCHFVHINSLLQLHEPVTRKKASRSTFFSTSALLCISALLRAFMTNYLNYPFFIFWCNQYSGSCFWNYAMMNTPIFRHRETFFLVACMLSLARSSTTTTAATPFLFPFILPTTPRGRAGARGSSSAVISRARQKDSSRVCFGTGPISFLWKKKPAKDLMTIIQCTTGSIKCIISRLN